MNLQNQDYHSCSIAVPAEFEEVFSHFYFAKNQSGKSITKTLLPSYQTILVFNFGASAMLHSKQNTQIELDKCLVLGPIKHAFDYTLPPASEILVANFKDDAFYRFFGNASVAENLPTDPNELFDEKCFTTLWNELNQVNDPNMQVERILDFCRLYLKERDNIAGQLANFRDNTLNSIKSIANRQGQSERNIQLNHKKHFGYSAKEVSRYHRFSKAIELIQHIAANAEKIDWFEIIDECGYYDQSQLIHDFKHYLNLSPTQYLKFQQDICNPQA